MNESFIQNLIQVLKARGLVLFVLTAVGLLGDQMITQLVQKELMNPDGASNFVWGFALLSVLWSLLIPLLALFFGAQALAPHISGKHFSHLVREQMRSLGKIMLWSLLFVIPGVYKYLRYLLVPFVVLFDPKYQAGERDALETSHRQSRGYLAALSFLFLFFAVIFPGILSSLDEKRLFLLHPASALLVCFIEMILNICFIVTLYRLYHRSLDPKEFAHEPAV